MVFITMYDRLIKVHRSPDDVMADNEMCKLSSFEIECKDENHAKFIKMAMETYIKDHPESTLIDLQIRDVILHCLTRLHS